MLEKLKKILQGFLAPKGKKRSSPRKGSQPKSSKTSRSSIKKKSPRAKSSASKPSAKEKSSVSKKKAPKKSVTKKKVSKKTTTKKTVSRKKTTATKKKAISKKRTVPQKGRATQKKLTKRPAKRVLPSKSQPLSKTAEKEEGILVGEITHYFSRIEVVVLKMTQGKIAIGDKISIKGKKTRFTQQVKSLQVESIDVKSAKKGQLVGLQVSKKVDVGDQVYKI